jgi:hypothetical protein
VSCLSGRLFYPKLSFAVVMSASRPFPVLYITEKRKGFPVMTLRFLISLLHCHFLSRIDTTNFENVTFKNAMVNRRCLSGRLFVENFPTTYAMAAVESSAFSPYSPKIALYSCYDFAPLSLSSLSHTHQHHDIRKCYHPKELRSEVMSV